MGEFVLLPGPWFEVFSAGLATRESREKIHSPDRGRDSKLLARPLIHAQNLSMAANPTLLPAGQLWGQDQDQFDVRAFHHPRLGVHKYTVGAHVAGLSDRLCFAGSAADADRQLGDNSLTRPSIDLIIHTLEFALLGFTNLESEPHTNN